MPAEIISQLNWVDIFVVILLVRICYIAIRTGLPTEFFKLSGVLFAVYLAMHYYILFAEFAREKTGFKNALAGLLNFSAFLILAVSGYFIFVLLRSFFYRFIKMDATATLNRWGGFIFGALRGFLLSSLILFMFIVSPGNYFKDSVNNSYSGKYLLHIAPSAYSMLWSGILSKFRPAEKFNDATREPIKNLEQK